MDVLRRNNVSVTGPEGAPPMVFAHGFGCDQQMWRHVAPVFEPDHRVVLFDHVGAGGSDLTAYDPARYSSLAGYALDLVEILDALALGPAVVVGHSVSSVIALLAAADRPELFDRLVLVGPSPRYIDDEGYIVSAGGLTEAATAATVGARAVLLDLSGVTFFDSAGVRLVDRLARACARNGAGFRVLAPTGGRARRILDLVGLGEVLACEDLDAAVAALQ